MMETAARCSRLARVAVVAAAALLGAAAGVASAAEVALVVSARQTEVGVPVTVQLTVTDADQIEPIIFPAVADADVVESLAPSRREMTQIINGRVTHSVQIVQAWEITPRRTGTLVIPPITVVADGQRFTTDSQTVRVQKSDAGERVIVEIRTDRSTPYVGESVTATLRVWILPFTDPAFRVTLRAADMWQMVDLRRSTWGLFAEPLNQLLSAGRRPRGEEATRRDAAGVERRYYVYELETTLWMEKAGPLELDDVRVLVSYPTRLQRQNSFFFREGLEVGASRTIAVTARVEPPVTVKAVPTAGRPATFNGAVGAYEISVTAKPTEAAVGDPITLTIALRGTGRLELLQPPPLNAVEELVGNFRLPDDPLAGVVEGDRKVFTVSIRANNASVTRIPAIPFTYFDPRSGNFVTVHSRAIPLRIRPAERLEVSQIIDARVPSGPTRLTEHAGGILSNYAGVEVLLRQQSLSFGGGMAAAVAAPPLVCAVCWAAVGWRRRTLADVAGARRRTAGRAAREAIAAATRNGRDVGAVAAALRHYVADRLNLPRGGLTDVETVDRIEQQGASAATVAELRAFLERCAQVQYVGGGAGLDDGLAQEAERLVERLEREQI